ncbi:MAG: sodium:proton antiporter [Planctomycetota bacterium]|nr:sodium:proton antiporter [Planctomycetota bacterium]
MPEEILTTLAAAVILGAIGQALASAFRLPSIIFLLAMGIAFGPQGLDLVRPESLGEGLHIITAIFVAIILFEGGLGLPPHVLREANKPVRRLISVGSLVTMVGGAILCRSIMEFSWPLSLLFGSLVIVTGPTVVIPILRRVRVTPRLHAVLKSEGILIDAIGAITAVVVLEYVMAIESSVGATLWGMFTRLGVGLIVGVAIALVAVLVWQWRVFKEYDNHQLVCLGALGVAFVAYAIAEHFYSESGIMATTASGLVLAAMPIPFREELEEFKETLTIFGVSILFVLLSANMDWLSVFMSGWREISVVLGLMFVVRPISVWLSTIGTDLSLREKIFMSLLAPRGIVAAAMASHFAVVMHDNGFENAHRVESLVFLTIGITVVVQGSMAGLLARWLDVTAKRPTGVLLVGVNTWSLLLAEKLKTLKIFVRFIDVNPVHCERARELGFSAAQADVTHEETFVTLDLSDLGTLVAMTSNDAVNTIACDEANDWLGREHVCQVISKSTAGDAKPRVRRSGAWAMPSSYSHQSICMLIKMESLHVHSFECSEPLKISIDMQAPLEVIVPLLVVKDHRVNIAVDGMTCPEGSTVYVLAKKPPAVPPAEDAVVAEPVNSPSIPSDGL